MPVKISSYIRCCRSLQETLQENALSGRAAPVQYLKELRVLLQLRYEDTRLIISQQDALSLGLCFPKKNGMQL